MLDEALELAKLEYEKCAERYENVYKSIWTQFNYSLIAAGAILTFGKEHYPASMLALGAALCLIFWYWATYEPLNGYGDRVSVRAAEIEWWATETIILAHKTGETANIAPGTSQEHKDAFPISMTKPRAGMFHFTDFLEGRKPDKLKLGKWPLLMVPVVLAALTVGGSAVLGLRGYKGIHGDASITLFTCLFCAAVASPLVCLLLYRTPLGRVKPKNKDDRNPVPRVRTTVRVVFLGLHICAAFLLLDIILLAGKTSTPSKEEIKITITDNSSDARAAGIREAISSLRPGSQRTVSSSEELERSIGKVQEARNELKELKAKVEQNASTLQKVLERLKP